MPSARKIQDYGLIGNCRAAALVSDQGSIDWLCWPRFDSPPIFAGLIDPDCGGCWSISPCLAFKVQRAYLKDSNILEQTFCCPGGRVILTDLMPVASEEFKRRNPMCDQELVRQVRCIDGEVQINIHFQPRASFGHWPIRIRDLKSLGLRMDVGHGTYFLRSNVPLLIQGNHAQAVVNMAAGDVLQFSFSYSEEAPAVLSPLGQEIDGKIERSLRWWRGWAARCVYDGPYREELVRSALTLKLLAYAPSGAIIAAPTTSLPERLGGDLNWDYRYCWLRDASLTVRALLGLGYLEEAESFLAWLLNTTRLTQPKLRVLYTVYGENAPREHELKDLRGFHDSQPVRIGNGARQQLQLDTYGEVVDAAAQYAHCGGRFDLATANVITGFGKYVANNWDQPDEGIWEPRSGRSNHTHSRLMCWTTLDRLLALHDKGVLRSTMRDLFARERQRIHQQLVTRAWNDRVESYVSVLDSEGCDATLLRIPWYGFEAPDSERMKKTFRRVRSELGAGDSLLYRYKRQPPEGAFGICSFWQAEFLAIGGGSLEQAHRCFSQLLKYRSDLGLLAEEIQPETGDALGNFPQAFTHVGLISAALSIEERERGAAHPAQHTGQNVKSTGQRIAA